MSAINSESVPLTSNGATTTNEILADDKIDPSIGQAISHGTEPITSSHLTNGTAPTSEIYPAEKTSALGGSNLGSTAAASSNADVATTTTTTIM